MFTGKTLPRLTDWQAFERLCRDLWAAIWKDPNTQLNGRSGQPQHGVDVFGTPSDTRALSGVQCKRRQDGKIDHQELTEKDLREEVENAKKFSPPIRGSFILATTAPRDGKIQAVARAISAEHENAGLFRVYVYAWDDIEELLGGNPEVFLQHFPDIVATVREFDRRPQGVALGVAKVAEPVETVGGRAQAQLVFSVDRIGGVLESEHRAQVDQLRGLLRDGHAALALNQGEALRARVWATATELARAHILILISRAQLALGKDDEGARTLIQTISHAPADAASRANAALGFLLTGNEESARHWANGALELAPLNPLALQIAIVLDEREDDAIVASYEPEAGHLPELHLALASRAARRGDLASARSRAERALALAPDNPEVKAMVAQLLVEDVQSELDTRYLLTAERRAQLLRAADLAASAWGTLRDDSTRKANLGWLVSVTIAKRLLRAPDLAEVADRLFELGGDRSEIALLRAAVAADLDDHARVVALLGSARDLPADARGLLAAARANLGGVAASVSEWEALLADEHLPAHMREQAENNYARALGEADADKARKVVAGWISETPQSIPRFLIGVEIAARLSGIKRLENASVLVQLLFDIGRRKDALETIYEARRAHFDEPEAHLLYIGWHHTLDDMPAPERVSPEAAVELEGAGAPGWLLITNDAHREHGEFLPTSPLSDVLLNKQVGDHVALPNKPHVSWRIKTVATKYAFAFVQSLELLPARFPEEARIEAHAVPDNPDDFVAQLKTRLAGDESFRDRAIGQYGAGRLTIGALARILGRSAVEAVGIAASSPHGLVSCTNSMPEREDVASTLANRNLVLVVDITACLIMDALGLLESDAFADRRFAATQSTVDELLVGAAEWRRRPREGFMSIGVDKDKLYRIEVSGDAVQANVQRFERLEQFIKTQWQVIGVPAPLAERYAPKAQLSDLIGQSFWDSMLVASQDGFALLSDDLRLRQLFVGEFRRPTICSAQLMEAAYHEKRLDEERYARALVALARANYRELSVNANVLLATARAGNWQVSDDFRSVLAALDGTRCDVRSACAVAVFLLRGISIEVVLPQRRTQLYFAVLAAVASGRRVNDVLRKLRPLLRSAFALLPLNLPEVEGALAAWERLRVT